MQVQTSPAGRPLLLCFSHLRWNFVTQRPQHLLRRATRDYSVVYWEEPEFGGPETCPALHQHTGADGVTVITPSLPWNDAATTDRLQRALLDSFLADQDGPPALAWFYTPMAFGFAAHVAADTVVYDCMDELAAFAGASPRLMLLERRLMRRADLVFTGGRSLQRAKQPLHPDVHCFPSAVDCRHYAKARDYCGAEPADQADIPHPRIGFFGVLDERMDIGLVESVADQRPDWHIVLIGPIAKIDEDELPRRPNIHWLGPKNYAELPAYLGCWDAGLMPFALNEATRFISPTKTPEFLAAGVPLVSTPVADVVATWSGVVSIAAGADAAVSALQTVLDRPRAAWLAQVDRALAGISWDDSWAGMQSLIESRQTRLSVAQAGD